MITLFKKIFGGSPATDYATLLKEGAQIIDVRSTGEYRSGHIRGSVNIPLDTLQKNLSKIKKDRPVITCCASGMRSASARDILKATGFSKVYNGGGWMSLEKKLN